MKIVKKFLKLILIFFPKFYCKINAMKEKHLYEKFSKKLSELEKISEKLRPACGVWEDGFDRYFINDYVEINKKYIKGDVLEFAGGNTVYSKKYGDNPNVKLITYIGDKGNYQADYYADLMEPKTLPAQKFDCIVATQVFMCMENPYIALNNLKSLLKPNGVLIFTIQGPLYPHRTGYMFAYTERSLKHLFMKVFNNYNNFKYYGNLEYTLYMLYGMKKNPYKKPGKHDQTFTLTMGITAINN